MTEKKEEPNREFVTSTGKVIHLRPVANELFTDAQATVEREFKDAEKPVEPPEYILTFAGGNTDTRFHDDVSIKTATDEEKEAWEAHQECLEELKTEQNERTIVIAIIEGVLDEPTDEWLARMAYYQIKLPKDPYDLKVRYVTRELLRTPEDMASFSAAVMLLSAGMEVDQVAIEAAMESFRDSVRGAVGPLLEKLAETLAKRGEAKLELQSEVPEGASGGEPGQVDDRIQPDEQG